MVRTSLVAAALGSLALTACGDRVFSRPSSYGKQLAFPTTGNPVDLNDLIRRHPEFDGIVMLAPTYNEILEREMADLKARGLPPIPEYRISPGTAFQFAVGGEPHLGGTFNVGPHGYVDLPLAGEVVVMNKTLKEVKDEVTLKLRRYFINPQVTINPVALYSQTGLTGRPRAGSIAVFNEGGAGNIDYVGDETIIKLLAAGGLGGNSDWRQVRVIQRPNAARGRPRGRIIIVDVVAFAFGDFRQDFPMQADDIVFIPAKWSWWEQFDQGWGYMLRFLQGPLTIEGMRQAYRTTF